MKTPIVSISEVYINDKKTKLKDPFLLDISFEDDKYIIRYEGLGLLAISDSLEIAIKEIEDEFTELWEEYVNCPEDELTEDAKILRIKLKEIVLL